MQLNETCFQMGEVPAVEIGLDVANLFSTKTPGKRPETLFLVGW